MSLLHSGSTASDSKLYPEDVFSTYLYTGNSSTQTINNGIDLAGKGGLTWFAGRNGGPYEMLFDSARGVTKYLLSGLTNAQGTSGAGERLTAYNNNGFSLGTDPGISINASGYNYVSWTFRKAAKFFDVVTYTGNGANRTIAHNLGSVPGCIIVKRTDTTSNWQVYHNGLSSAAFSIQLNLTNAQASAPTVWNSTAPTSTVFSVGTDASVNASGGTYVAYVFAHNAGGFGLTGTDNVISCGSYTTDVSGNGTFQNLGYEPQWLMVKAATGTAEDWVINDNMRGMRANPAGSAQALFPNTSGAEVDYGLGGNLSATGFTGFGSASRTYIYLAIRRPNKPPTTGTQVFMPVTTTNDANPITTGFPVDLAFENKQSGNTYNTIAMNRLVGDGILVTSSTAAEATGFGNATTWFQSNTSITPYIFGATNIITWNFRRAPGFMDVVCYRGTGSATTVAHNLGAVPELMIVKGRSQADAWWTYHSTLGNTQAVALQTANAVSTSINFWNNTTPTTTQFTVGPSSSAAGVTKVAYLFATVAGVSKVGSYTGSGTTKQIDCGFTAGARFVLIKRTDSTGDWYVWDSVRGIVAANDPHLSLNSTAAEVTTDDSIDPAVEGFIVNQNSATNINVLNGTYIYFSVS